MSSTRKQYELVLLGATGYTGKYCAEHITASLPSDLRWAVAGRNEGKLSAVVQGVKSMNPDRLQPGIEIVSLTPEDLNTLCKKTKLIMNTVGPYHLYSTPVVEACARNGTHYVDATGETPWVLDLIRKYHDLATTNKSIIIPQCGLESAMPDMITYALISMIRKELFVGVKDVITTTHELIEPSGGTLATVVGIFDAYSTSELLASMKPWALSPTTGPELESESLMGKVLGVRSVPGLGLLTDGIAVAPDTAYVQRSWGLLSDFYGPKFRYKEYSTARSYVGGVAWHFALTIGMIALALPPVRWLLKKFIYQPGEGPSKESMSKDRLEYRAVATADTSKSQQAFAKLIFEGNMYKMTGIVMSEAAMVILRGKSTAHKMGGGVLTTATLGDPFVDRLRTAGISIEANIMYG